MRSAERWRCVKASRRYRASVGGRERRRRQSRQYRQRRREKAATLAAPTAPTALNAPTEELAGCEGQRPASSSENYAGRMCDRPGCYVVFGVRHEHSSRRFCSVACCMALRRVLDREARYRRRRRRWRRQRLGRRIRPPDTS